MPDTRSLIARRWPELVWGVFAALNVAVMLWLDEWQTVPFHFVWVSLTILYGFRVWSPRSTAAVLGIVGVATGAALLKSSLQTGHGIDEMTEVPLMSAMFVAMVWHARRRAASLAEVRAAAEREREFIRDASHLLRTPITVARGHAELLAALADGQTQRDLEVIVGELQRLSRISDRLLVLASAEHPRFTSVRQVSLPSLVAQTVRRWSVAEADREWSYEAPAAGTVRADEERLVCALDALVENAVKATSPGDRIVVRGRADGGDAVVEGVDGGVGIPPEALPRIFERFARQPHPGGGTGLGMPIVKAIVEAHGGTITVASTPGKGTSVRMRLPGFAPIMNGA
jgi:two-component system, OmpR family, sensor kinase